MHPNLKKILTWVAFFVIFFGITQYFNKKKTEVPPEQNGLTLIVTVLKTDYATDEEVSISIKNNSSETITLPASCPKNPLRVLAWNGTAFEERTAETQVNCELVSRMVIAPHSSSKVSYNYWNHSLFGNPGRYKVEVDFKKDGKPEIFSSPEFTVSEAGFWRRLFRTAFYQPLYNILAFFIKIAPARDLGFAIIMMTILIRLVLLVPSQRAIVSQRAMQELQPKLEHIKKKYAGNKERIASETMQLWKEHKVNPFGSCLPILVQFPVLIALFYVIQSGLNPDNAYLLYGPLKNVDLRNLHTNFLGIPELTRVNMFVLPIIVGALQFLQLKLTMAKKKAAVAVAVAVAVAEQESKPSEMETANKTMTYIMPIMIAVFTASVPAGVGLYWGVSTIFALGQQLVANKK